MHICPRGEGCASVITRQHCVLGIQGDWFPGVMDHHSGITADQKTTVLPEGITFKKAPIQKESKRQELVFSELEDIG